jgi:hypothetical protein
MIERYLATVYEDGGTGPYAYNCWTLVRAVRHEVFGYPLLPIYGAISPDDKHALTDACNAEAQAFHEGPPSPGAIATVWRGQICIHVGICIELDGRLGVLETGRKCGPRWLCLGDFERRYLKVIYHNDRKCVPQHTAGRAA